MQGGEKKKTDVPFNPCASPPPITHEVVFQFMEIPTRLFLNQSLSLSREIYNWSTTDVMSIFTMSVIGHQLYHNPSQALFM